MKKTRFNAFVVTVTGLLLFICTAAGAEFSNKGVVHAVYLWLKKQGDEQHIRQLLLATDRLREIPDVLDIHYGETIASDRAIVDDSFDVGIYVYFSDAAAMKRYLVHSTHKRIVNEDIKHIVDRIVVHDFYDVVLR
jgi:hypothetical protein